MITISFEVTDEPPRLIVTERTSYDLERLWLAETEGLYVKQWWAPEGYTNDEVDLSIEPGGSWRVIQRDPQGNQFSFYGRVDEVIARERLQISLTSEVFPETTLLLTQEFAAADGGAIVVSIYEFPSEEALAGYLGFGGTDRLRGASAKLDLLLAQMTA